MNQADVVQRLVAAIEARDADRFAALFADDAIGHHPLLPEPIRGRDAIRESERALFEAFSDVDVEVRWVVGDGRRCAIEAVLRATNTGPLDMGDGDPLPPTGRRVEVPATWWYELGDDGLIVETRDYLDTAGFTAQLGLQPDAAAP